MKPMLFFEYETLVNAPDKILIKKSVLQKIIDDAYAAGVEDGKKDALIEELQKKTGPSNVPLWNYRDIDSEPWYKKGPTVSTVELLNKDAERQIQKDLHSSTATPHAKSVEITC